MSDEVKKALEMRDRLNKVSPSFCLAKWMQVTLHLHNGLTHSCHHPIPHKIPLDEIKKDVSALHNTSFKKVQRSLMLEGTRPKECDYCWNIEDSGGKPVSDRYLKSGESWAEPFFNKIAKSKPSKNVNPTSVEVSFSSKCNFKCAYCSPDISSKWMEEVEEFGPYPTHPSFNNLHYFKTVDRMPIPESEENPYVEAFWKWWPELSKDLKVFRITGGEPLLSRNTFRVLEDLLETPRPELSLAINSNLGVPRALVNKFAELASKIVPGKDLKDFSIFTSLDAWGAQAEYIRFGLQFDLFLENLRYLLEHLPQMKFTIMCTFNGLSVSGFGTFLTELAKLKREYPYRISLDTPYLRYPDFFTVKSLTADFEDIMSEHIELIETIPEYQEYEKIKVRRILDWMKEPVDPRWLLDKQEDFFIYFTEYDRRRGTNFLKTFPQMSDYWTVCEKAHRTSQRPAWK